MKPQDIFTIARYAIGKEIDVYAAHKQKHRPIWGKWLLYLWHFFSIDFYICETVFYIDIYICKTVFYIDIYIWKIVIFAGGWNRHCAHYASQLPGDLVD